MAVRCVLFPPAKCPFFYGYVICVLAGIVQMQVITPKVDEFILKTEALFCTNH